MTITDNGETELIRRMRRSGRLYCPKIFGWLSDNMRQKVLASRARSEKYRATRAKTIATA